MRSITADEYLKCIKIINPEALVTIRQDSPDADLYPKWDDAHTGARPTLEECEAVLPQVRAEISREQAINAIQSILDEKARDLGFDSLHTSGMWRESNNPDRKARADALFLWGDAVWDFAEAEAEKQEKGESTFQSVEDLLAALPEFTFAGRDYYAMHKL